MRVLTADQAATDLRHRAGWDDRLRTRSSPAAADAVDLQRRSGGYALADRKLLLTPLARDASRGQELFLGHVRLGDLGPFLFREWDDIVVEARHGDAVVGVVHPAEDLDQRQRRVVDRASIEAAVQIIVRTGDLDLQIG